MGVDTKVRLRGHISPDRICCYLESKYKNVRNEVKTTISVIDKTECDRYICYDDNNDFIITESGFIHFTDNIGDKRSLFYYRTNINDLTDLISLYEYNKFGTIDDNDILFNVIETTRLSLGLFGNSIDIMKDICNHLGGWIDENDCDDESFYWIDKE